MERLVGAPLFERTSRHVRPTPLGRRLAEELRPPHVDGIQEALQRAIDAGHGVEALTLIAAGKGVFPVGAHAARFYPRPEIAYIPIDDAPPIRWGPVWLTANSSGRVREFVRAASDATASSPTD